MTTVTKETEGMPCEEELTRTEKQSLELFIGSIIKDNQTLCLDPQHRNIKYKNNKASLPPFP